MKILSVFISFIPSLIFCFFFYKKKSFFKFIIISILLWFLYISLFTNKTVIENLVKLTEFRISCIFKFYILTFIVCPYIIQNYFHLLILQLYSILPFLKSTYYHEIYGDNNHLRIYLHNHLSLD